MNHCRNICNKSNDYFYGRLSKEDKYEVISHLLNCKKCLAKYINDAASVGLSFDLLRECLHLGLNMDNASLAQDKWSSAAKSGDLTELMNIKAVRDIVLSTKNDTTDEDFSDKIRQFGLFLIKKICQKIDHLEQCLAMEGANNA